MNISKYVDFYLTTIFSKKKNQDYYCIAIIIDDKTYPISFISKDTYDLLSSKLK